MLLVGILVVTIAVFTDAPHHLNGRLQCVVMTVAVDVGGLLIDLDRSPARVHQQLLGPAFYVPILCEDLLQSLGLIRIPADDLPCKRHH